MPYKFKQDRRERDARIKASFAHSERVNPPGPKKQRGYAPEYMVAFAANVWFATLAAIPYDCECAPVYRLSRKMWGIKYINRYCRHHGSLA